jgi:hypothetical protein
LAPDTSHALGFIAFLLLPSAIYSFSVMPETDMVLLGCVLTWLAVVETPRAPMRSAAIAGPVVAAALLTKPHALAILAALLVYLPLTAWSSRGREGRLQGIASPLVLMVSTWLSLVVLWRLLTGRLTFDPGVFLGLTFYGKSLWLTALAGGAAQKWLSVLGYFLANLAVILLVFSTALVGAVHAAWQLLPIRRAGDPKPHEPAHTVMGELALFTLLMTGAHLVMTAHFTAGAAILSDVDAMRLHGRYLSPAIATLPFLTFYYLRHASSRLIVSMALTGVVAAAAFLLLVVPNYRIYPWDNPLLFAFYQSNNHYGFHFSGLLPQPGWFLAVILLTGHLAALLWRRRSRPIIALLLLFVLACGHVLVLDWLCFHSRSNRDLVAQSAAAATIVGSGAMGDGVLVSESRFGNTSYILYTLANAPKVLLRPAGSVVSAEDVGDARWVLINGRYAADIGIPNFIELGPLRLYAENLLMEQSTGLPEMQIGEVHGVQLASRQVRTTGFNDPEEWGRWSAVESAFVHVGRRMHGRFELEFVAWTLPENTHHALAISAGGPAVEIHLSDAGRTYRQYIDIDKETDTIRFSMPTVRPASSHRDLGVALGRLKIRKVSGAGDSRPAE